MKIMGEYRLYAYREFLYYALECRPLTTPDTSLFASHYYLILDLARG